MFFPDYFIDRAKKCLELAKRMRNPKLAQTFAERARVLTQTAMEAERTMARANGADKSPPVIISQAKTLAELRGELQNLHLGMSVKLSIKDFQNDQKDEFWRACPALTLEFGCRAEFRPDGCLWFVRR